MDIGFPLEIVFFKYSGCPPTKDPLAPRDLLHRDVEAGQSKKDKEGAVVTSPLSEERGEQAGRQEEVELAPLPDQIFVGNPDVDEGVVDGCQEVEGQEIKEQDENHQNMQVVLEQRLRAD